MRRWRLLLTAGVIVATTAARAGAQGIPEPRLDGDRTAAEVTGVVLAAALVAGVVLGSLRKRK